MTGAISQSIRGNLGLMGKQFTEGAVLFRFAAEKSELRKEVRLEKKIKSLAARLSAARKSKDAEKLITQEEDGIRALHSYIEIYKQLMGHILYDTVQIKHIMKEVYEIDKQVEAEGLKSKGITQSEQELIQQFLELNKVLATLSDQFGAASRSK